MAAGLMRQRVHDAGLDSEINVFSAGVYALEGRPASQNARIALSERGIDISDHVAHTLEVADLKAADIVLVMEEAHRRSIFYTAPQYLGKVFLLSEMSGKHDDVHDPFGEALIEYERCATNLERLLEQGEPQIMRRLGVEHQ